MFGAPGETPETIAESLHVLSDYDIPLGVWVTLGIYLWTDYQDIVTEARQTGYLRGDQELFTGTVYPARTDKALPQGISHRPARQAGLRRPGQQTQRAIARLLNTRIITACLPTRQHLTPILTYGGVKSPPPGNASGARLR